MTEKEILKQEEEEFYRIQEDYLKTGSKQSWDKMFFAINKAIEASVKKKLKGVLGTRSDLYDLVMDATCKVMNRYKNTDKYPEGYRIKFLLTAAHFAAQEILYNPKQQRLDMELSYEAYQEYQYAQEEK